MDTFKNPKARQYRMSVVYNSVRSQLLEFNKMRTQDFDTSQRPYIYEPRVEVLSALDCTSQDRLLKEHVRFDNYLNVVYVII